MLNSKYRHLVVNETQNHYDMTIETAPLSKLKPNELLIKVAYSSVNYKDVLSCYGNRGVTKTYPHTPGIDASGVISKSTSPEFKPGDQVIVTGYDLGMNTSGGFSEYISVPASWAVRLPDGLSLRDAMIYGTAGFTAALSVYALKQSGITAKSGPILVTGATGGVGSIAVSLLSKLNYHVVAASGKPSETSNLYELGAKEIISRYDFGKLDHKALLSEKWGGAVDTVGGNILPEILKSTKYNGCVTCCGNVAGADFKMTVYPFILRGISLIGIDSGHTSKDLRNTIWSLLGDAWRLDIPDKFINEITLDELPDLIIDFKNGNHKHRTIVRL